MICFETGRFHSSFFSALSVSIEPLMASGIHRIPAIERAEIREMINGPESFTPDGHAIMGEAPEVK